LFDGEDAIDQIVHKAAAHDTDTDASLGKRSADGVIDQKPQAA